MVQYSTAIEEQRTSIDNIESAINRRLKQQTSADNPVHEVIAALPAHLIELLDQDPDAQRKRITELEQEKERLLKKIIDLGGMPGAVSQGKKTSKEIFAEAKLALPFSSSIAVDRIEGLSKEGKLEELLEFLEEVFSHGKIFKTDANKIIKICEDIGNLVINECVLQMLVERFPDDTVIQTRLARVYAYQPAKKSEAVALIDSALGLQKDETGSYCDVNPSSLSHNNLVDILNTYRNLGLYNELVDVCWFLMDHGAEQHKDMLLRNIFSSLSMSYRFVEADELLSQVENTGTAVSYYCIATHYDRKGEPIPAYKYCEKSLIAEPTDADYPRFLAAHILDEKVLRVDGVIKTVSAPDAKNAALAVLFFAAEQAKNMKDAAALQEVLTILRRKTNGLTRFVDDVIQYWQGQIDELPYSECAITPLQYCLNRTGNAI